MVAEVLEQKRDEIVALDRKHRVRALRVFGSATRDTWDPERNDIDLLVDLGEYEAGVATRFLDLADGLEAAIGRPIDLVTVVGLAGNPRVESRVHDHRVMLYESGGDRSAA